MTDGAVPVLVVLTGEGLSLARRLAALLPEAEVHGLARRVEAGQADVVFDDTMEHLRGLFAAGRPIVGSCRRFIPTEGVPTTWPLRSTRQKMCLLANKPWSKASGVQHCAE